MANSVYGKFIENKSKHMSVLFCSTAKYLRKWIVSPRYSNFKIINDSLVAVFLKKAAVKATQAYAIGFSILDLSKEFMFRSYYTKIKPFLGETCKVLMSDTDSLFLSVQSEKEPHSKIKHILDTSNFDTDHPLYSIANKSKLGFFKSETGSKKIARFIGLRSKCYAFEVENAKAQTKCKGIVKSFRRKIPISAYEKCLKEIQSHTTTQYILRSKTHEIQLAKQKKLCFSSYDDKLFMLPCGIHTLPYGSHEITTNLFACTFCM